MVAGVLVEISSKNIDKVFEYRVPEELISKVKIGIRVLVPFGRMTLEGFLLEIKDVSTTDKDLKDILSIVDDEVVLNEELLSLGKEIQKNTLATLISCYQTMLPKALKAKNGSNVPIKFDVYYRLNETVSASFNATQQKIVQLVKKEGSVLRKRLVDISLSSVNTLVKKGVLIEEKREHYRLQYGSRHSSIKKLTPEQEKVVSQVIQDEPHPYLLYGVTGSGKTEVYMEIIEHYLKQGKSSIVLVPEISLTPQMIQRFHERFGDQIAAIHSGLSDGEKYDEWRRILKKEASIVIGARSAIFAPVSNIGVIIIDEEHSDSYKQSDPSPRYHARDVAIWRAKYHHCSVVLGSATPSLESMARAEKGVYTFLFLLHRVNGKKLPTVQIIDMNQEIKKSKGHFSLKLLEEIQKKVALQEQVILLLNRRGYASFVTCQNCGYTFKCPNCDITLTYHKSSNTLRCHYCGYGEKVFEICPKCGAKAFHNLGVGTQRIEEELSQQIPGARILRMDYDTTSQKGKHEEMIQAFQEHRYDILLGTQMVAKGLDFPNVTLVGVIHADTSLNIPDFRSSENTFSLLSQVAGRSGRNEKEGSVMIQTFNPDHYAIQLVKNHDYLSFYKKEMSLRKQLKYPPYYYLCDIRISGEDAQFLFQEAQKIKVSLEKNLPHTIILGPSGATVFKMNRIYRYHIILKYKKEERLNSLLLTIVDHYKSHSKIKINIDFNPSQIL